MSMQIKILSSLALALTLAAGPAGATSAAAQADLLLETGRYAQALRVLERASEAGDIRAAEQAGLMHLYGPVFYGSEVPQDVDCALRHLVRAARGGSAAARTMVERIGFPLAGEFALTANAR